MIFKELDGLEDIATAERFQAGKIHFTPNKASTKGILYFWDSYRGREERGVFRLGQNYLFMLPHFASEHPNYVSVSNGSK